MIRMTFIDNGAARRYGRTRLSMTVPAAPMNPASPPPAPAGAAKNELERRTPQNELEKTGSARALAWECSPGYSCYFSCYFDAVNGGGSSWKAPGCGFWDLSGTFLQDHLFSINNRGSGVASVYNWTGHGYEL